MIEKILYFFVIIMIVSSCSPDNAGTDAKQIYRTQIVIDYGGLKPIKMTGVKSLRRLTALEALQYVSVVETHPVGKHVFVSTIDSIKTVRGDMAWYYKVNGESPGVLAINNKINNGDTIRWIYKTDVCSSTVDKN